MDLSKLTDHQRAFYSYLIVLQEAYCQEDKSEVILHDILGVQLKYFLKKHLKQDHRQNLLHP